MALTAGKKQTFPSKTTLNLVIKERPSNYSKRLVIYTVLGVLVLAAFAKFAVIDRIADASNAWAETNREVSRYEQLIQDNAEYTAVRAEYEKYFTSIDSDVTYADCMDVISLIESRLMNAANVQSLAVSDNTLTAVLTGITLEDASVIVNSLYENELVDSVTLGTAGTAPGGSSVSITIRLAAKGGVTE